jgi:pSer/pThr/pTyr-binding forkhead associated (FHA) protein
VKLRGNKEPYLEVIEGCRKGERFKLDQEVVRIGAVAKDEESDNENEIVLADRERTISRFHCILERKNGKFYVFDCDSRNGTRVDKRKVPQARPVQLKKGARLDLAEACTLRLVFVKKDKA